MDECCIAQIGKNGSVIGAGFLIDSAHVMTCAHVINQCLGRRNETADRPAEADTVEVRFPWATGEAVYKGQVVAWFPLPLERAADARVDIAVLQLTPPAPSEVTLARLQSFPRLDGKEVRTAGFPQGYPLGRHAQGKISGADGAGWLQAQSRPDQLPFLGGHSGAPVFLAESTAVVGMISMSDDHKRDVGIFIPIDALKQAWPQLTVLSGGPRLNMAPPPPPDFVQRPHEFGALKEKLLGPNGNAVAITAALRGAGGYGKTTLATALGHDPDIEAAYPDGILWVELGEKPASLLSIVVDLIEIVDGERPGLENLIVAAAKLGETLADQRMLLIIDDAWRERDLRPLLRGGRNTTRLITTRRDDILPEEAVRQPVDAMVANEALALLSSGLPQDQAADQKQALAALAKRLGEWALLLKLVNSFLRNRVRTNHEPLLQAIAGVNRRLDVKGLTAFDARNEADRTNAVAKTIEVGLELLDENERARFEELAVFPEDVDVPIGVVSRLWCETGRLEEIDTEDLLRRLESLSLLLSLDLERRAFRIHDTVRHFLQDQAGKAALILLHKRLLKSLDGIEAEADTDEASRRYYYLQRPAHLAEAGERAALDALLIDPAWLQEKFDAIANTQLLIADYEQFGQTEAHSLIGQTLRLTSGILARDKRQLIPQLHGRLMTQAAASLFCGAALRLVQRPAIMMSSSSLTPPGTELARLEGHRGCVYAFAVLPDGRLASASMDRTLILWDPKTGAELTRLIGHENQVAALAVLPDGRLASGCWDRTVKIWDVKTGTEMSTLEGHSAEVWALAVLPDGRLASGSADNTIILWDPKTGAEVTRLKGHNGDVHSLAVLPDGRLASASWDNTVRLWDLTTGTEVIRLEGHSGAVHSLAVLPDGRLASGGHDNIIILWDPKTGAELTRLEIDAEVWGLAVLPDGRLVSGSNDNTIRIWDPISGNEFARLEGHRGTVYALAALPDGRIASGGFDGTVRLWDPKSSGALAGGNQHSRTVRALAALPHGRFASGSYDRTIRLWDAKTGAELARLEGHTDWVNALAVLPDGRLASGSRDCTLRLWNLKTGSEVARFEVDQKDNELGVRALAALPDGRLAFASAGIKFWNPNTGAAANLEDSFAAALAVLPDGRLASASEDNIILLDPKTGAEAARLEGHSAEVWALAVLPDGRLASGSWDRTIRLWDIKTGTEVSRLEGHSHWVDTLAVLPDGRLASGGHDNIIILWDPKTGAELTRLEIDAEVECIVALPDGRVVVGDAIGRIHCLEILE